jgi:GT2 family glycosyltransferase
MDIPIIIISYNNYKYIKNTLNQILKINKEYYKSILPIIGEYIEKNIPNWFVNLSNELKKI